MAEPAQETRRTRTKEARVIVSRGRLPWTLPPSSADDQAAMCQSLSAFISRREGTVALVWLVLFAVGLETERVK